MTSGDLLKLFRSEMSDAVQPYLWSDTDVYGYIDDAQKMFCRNTDGISDTTTAAITQLPITPGLSFFPISPLIQRIRAADRSDTGAKVEILNREDLQDRGWRYDNTTGVVKALIIGEEEGKARTFPLSNETVTINLMVYRLPIDDIYGDQDFEIPAKHHQHLLLWVKAMAYMKQDAETFDKSKSAEFDNKFGAYCEKSKAESRRAQHKNRVVRYGGI